MSNKIIFNPIVMKKITTGDIYLRNLVSKFWLEIAFNTAILDWEKQNWYKDKYIKCYNDMGFNDDLVYKNWKYITNDGWYSDGSPETWKFSYCAMLYNWDKTKIKLLYIPVIKDLKYWKLKISWLKTIINRLSDFYGFWKDDKNLEVLFNSEFLGKTYNNTRDLFSTLNNTIEKSIKNKWKKVWETPKWYF